MIRKLPLLFLLFELVVAAESFGSGFRRPVRIESGLLSGVVGADPSVMVFKGVPYAAPPVGDLRWRAPRLPARWQGVRNASQFAPNCPQSMKGASGPWTSEYQAHGQVSEDCLYLNVWTTSPSAREHRPVLVFIHGGAFKGGSGSVPLYDGENLAKRGIVVVTINYRLGLLGFLAHPELTQESEHGSSGNYGLLDQLAALQWVQRNIASFGGDPRQVTVMGQSAGAGAVHFLISSPLARSLFARAIAESGSDLRIGPGKKRQEAEQDGTLFAQLKGVHSIKELRTLPVAALMAPAQNIPAFRPIVDGWFLPDPVAVAYAEARHTDVPMLTGWNFDEGSSRESYGKLQPDQFRTSLVQQAGQLADQLLLLYPAGNQEEASQVEKESARDHALVGMHVWAWHRARGAHTKAYTYIFTHPTPGPTRERYGVFHSSELPYVFDNLNQSERPWTSQDREIARVLSAYWVNFIKTGDPNGPGLPAWPAFSPEQAVTMELGEKMSPRPVVDQAKFDVFRQLVEEQLNH